jgi:hypothetical protein
LRGKGTPFFSLRLPKAIRARLESDATDLGVTSSVYVRAILVAHLSLGRRQNQGVSHPVSHPSFDHAVKRFLLAYHMSISVAGLPGKERRNNLEGLSWAAVEEAVKFAKAQEDPIVRLLAMRVVSSLIRTELAILHEQDQAYVDELVAEVEANRRELETKIRAIAGRKAS